MLLAAALIVAQAVVAFAIGGPVSDAARIAYTAPPPKPDQVAAGVRFAFTLVGIVFIVVAIGELVLGLLDLRGSNVARIITWIFNGLVVLCFGCLGVLSLGRSDSNIATTGTPNQDGVDPVKFNKAVADAFPSWSGAVSGTLFVLVLIAALASIILLALPASNEYFRRRREGEGDAAFDLAYPATPGYPPVPTPPPPAAPPAPPPAAPPADDDEPPAAPPPAAPPPA
jgi:hypothetical protein